MARQIVSHGHITVNDKKVNIPSYRVKLNAIISLSAKAQKNREVLNSLAEKKDTVTFIKKEGIYGKLIRIPKKEDVQLPFDLQLVVEYYSR
jgi:small subunit ribosomal protein S4